MYCTCDEAGSAGVPGERSLALVVWCLLPFFGLCAHCHENLVLEYSWRVGVGETDSALILACKCATVASAVHPYRVFLHTDDWGAMRRGFFFCEG